MDEILDALGDRAFLDRLDESLPFLDHGRLAHGFVLGRHFGHGSVNSKTVKFL
jgi:hypothetical protein